MDEIKIKVIDAEKVEKDNSFPNAYAFYVILNKKPDFNWEQIFNANWKKALYMMKRRVTIERDRLRIITSDTDDNKKHLDFVKELIEETNKQYKKYIETEKKKEEMRKAETDEIEKTKNDLKSKLKNIRI